MDNIKLQDEVRSLQKLREHYEEHLKLAGIELCDFPDELSAALDECVELQTVTSLHDLSENYSKEFYYNKQREKIEKMHVIGKVQAELKEIETHLQNEVTENLALEKFLAQTNNRLVSATQMQRQKFTLEAEVKRLQERQKSLSSPDELNVDILIKKVELLKSKKTR